MLAKETAILLPLYAYLVEWMLFGFGAPSDRKDRRLYALFSLLLGCGSDRHSLDVAGCSSQQRWAARDFTLEHGCSRGSHRVRLHRLGLLPLPQSLSFYHAHFEISRSLLEP